MHRNAEAQEASVAGTRGGARGGRATSRERRTPWPWRLAATAAGVVLCGGLMLVLPSPDRGPKAPGVVGGGRAADEAGVQQPGYGIVMEGEPGKGPEAEAGVAPWAPEEGWAWPAGPAHTRTRPS